MSKILIILKLPTTEKDGVKAHNYSVHNVIEKRKVANTQIREAANR